MEYMQQRINTVITHYQNKDESLAFRMLMDCVLDTKNKEVYKKALELNRFREEETSESELIIEKSIALLEELKQFDYQVDESKEVLLHAKNISKRYSNFFLNKVDIEIETGDVWGLVGENGNGKTTLLKILANHIHHDSGVIEHNIEKKSAYELRTKLAYIPQRTAKWFGSVKYNLQYTASHYGIHGEENELFVYMYMIRFGLWKFRNHNWNQLSSGYKMRFELVRTLLRSPKILLLDEPLANLDVLAQQLILEDLKNIAQSKCNPIGIILSSQQLFEVEKISDKVLFLKNGDPTHLSTINSENEEEENCTTLELDSTCTKEELYTALTKLEVKEIVFNGGLYIIKVKNQDFAKVLGELLVHGIPITYVRDISKSSRRLFI